LNEAGHDALHTLDLPKKNFASDSEVIARAKQEQRIVVREALIYSVRGELVEPCTE
jgi:predicted nuclease of predicted toxin-antitoxin system